MALPRTTFASTFFVTTLLSPLAFAQVSDADRAAARELYIAGVKAQEAGRFDEGLDRFQRAEAVFPAPTNVLHIAECQAALGKLVESAESYRSLARNPLGPNPPPAFVQAQEQGKAELLQVEPRVPAVRVIVKPENTTNLRVTIDGQPMSSALVGVERPTDPGSHTIVVTATGYGRTEQTVTLKEREHKDVALNLAPSLAPPPPVTTIAPATTTPEPPPPPPYGAPPPPYERPPVYTVPPESRPVTGGFMLGPRLGLLAPGGSFTGDAGSSVGNYMGAGLSVGAEGGFRFARRFYLGLVYEHGFHGQGSVQDSAASAETGSISSTEATNYVGLNFVYISNPDGLGFYGEIGLGYRIAALTSSASANNAAESVTFAGGEAELGIGLHIKAGDWIRLVPKVSVAGGAYTSLECSEGAATISSLACSGVTGSTASTPANATIADTGTHSFLFLGITAYVDFARKQR